MSGSQIVNSSIAQVANSPPIGDILKDLLVILSVSRRQPSHGQYHPIMEVEFHHGLTAHVWKAPYSKTISK